MKKQLIMCAVVSMAMTVSIHAGVIYQDDFSGSSSNPLNGTTPDISTTGGSWTAASNVHADGTAVGSEGYSTAWLPYTFGASIYETTLTYSSQANVGVLLNTQSEPFGTDDFPGDPFYATTYVRNGSGELEFWAGAGTSGNVDPGTVEGAASAGTIRMVLDTTGANWTVNAYITPDGGSEVAYDLNPGDPGSTTYTYGTNPPALTAVGIAFRGSPDADSFTFAEVPEPATLSLLGVSGLLMLRQRRRS